MTTGRSGFTLTRSVAELAPETRRVSVNTGRTTLHNNRQKQETGSLQFLLWHLELKQKSDRLLTETFRVKWVRILLNSALGRQGGK